MIQTPKVIRDFSIVTRETVHIALMMVFLHDIEVNTRVVLNAYVMAPNRKIIWTVLGPEFGNNACKSTIIVRAVYRLKNAGASFQAHLSWCMQELV